MRISPEILYRCEADVFELAERQYLQRPISRGRTDSPGSLAQGGLHRDGPGTEESSPSPLTPGGLPLEMGRGVRATKVQRRQESGPTTPAPRIRKVHRTGTKVTAIKVEPTIANVLVKANGWIGLCFPSSARSYPRGRELRSQRRTEHKFRWVK